MTRSRKGRGAKKRRGSNGHGELEENSPEEEAGTHLEQVDLLDEIAAVSEVASDETERVEPDEVEPAEMEEVGLAESDVMEEAAEAVVVDGGADPWDPEGHTPLPSTLRQSLEEVDYLEEDGAHDDALARLLVLQTDHPESVVVVARLGTVLGSLGRFGEARMRSQQPARSTPTWREGSSGQR